jgi:hypothetical protein
VLIGIALRVVSQVRVERDGGSLLVVSIRQVVLALGTKASGHVPNTPDTLIMMLAVSSYSAEYVD